jgi:acetoacetyl-CoA synthetase
MSDAMLLWTPDSGRIGRSQMHFFMQKMAAKYGFAPDYVSMHRWSVTHRDQFWGEMFGYAGIKNSRPATSVESGSGMLDTRWFAGLEFNFAEHLLRFDDDRVAIEAEDEIGRTRTITYRQLRAEVAGLAAALQKTGLQKGDRVGAFMPNLPETIIAMLATASVGAIFSSCSPDFGIDGVIDRFGQIEPKILVAADAYSYNGKTIDLLERVGGIADRISSISHVIMVPFIGTHPKLDAIRGAVSWTHFVGNAAPGPIPDNESSQAGRPLPPGSHRAPELPVREQGGDALITDQRLPEDPPARAHRAPEISVREQGGEPLIFEQVSFDHPLYIMYSSGTTGVPKCIVHGQGGTLLQHMKELMLHCDLRRDDVIFYFTTCGWMMWNWLVSSLGVGATIVLYEGSPTYPTADRLWQLAERLGITVFGTSPKFVTACEKAGLKPARQHELTKLRAVLSTGSPLTIENFRWVYDNVKQNLQLSSICGGTDIISCFMLGNPILPVYAGEIQCIGLGMDVHAFDENGQPVIGEKGELVCCSPFPSQPVGFWNDRDGSKYREAYFDAYPDVWRHGDFIEITPRGSVIVYGRSDATLNPGGVRIGTAEIYRQVESIEEIVDSVVVGKNVADGDVEICLFVVLREGLILDAALEQKIRKRIAEGATKRHVPRHIKQVTAIPYTISGKKVELAVQRMLHGQPVPNRDALANPQALDQYSGLV